MIREETHPWAMRRNAFTVKNKVEPENIGATNYTWGNNQTRSISGGSVILDYWNTYPLWARHTKDDGLINIYGAPSGETALKNTRTRFPYGEYIHSYDAASDYTGPRRDGNLNGCRVVRPDVVYGSYPAPRDDGWAPVNGFVTSYTKTLTRPFQTAPQPVTDLDAHFYFVKEINRLSLCPDHNPQDGVKVTVTVTQTIKTWMRYYKIVEVWSEYYQKMVNTTRWDPIGLPFPYSDFINNSNYKLVHSVIYTFPIVVEFTKADNPYPQIYGTSSFSVMLPKLRWKSLAGINFDYELYPAQPVETAGSENIDVYHYTFRISAIEYTPVP